MKSSDSLLVGSFATAAERTFFTAVRTDDMYARLRVFLRALDRARFSADLCCATMTPLFLNATWNDVRNTKLV